MTTQRSTNRLFGLVSAFCAIASLAQTVSTLSPSPAPSTYAKPTKRPFVSKSSKISKRSSKPTFKPVSQVGDTDAPTTKSPSTSPSISPTASPTVYDEVVISFVMMGDIPYDKDERYCLNKQLRDLDPAVMQPYNFIIHVGDIKRGSGPCLERFYSELANIFTHPSNTLHYDPRDIFLLVGDNEWVDCFGPSNGFRKWMNHFGNGNKTHEGINTGPNPYGFGTFSDPQMKSTLEYDWQDNDGSSPHYPSSATNFAFFYNKVLFVGINQVGGDFVGDEATRVHNNFVWVKNRMSMYSSQGMRTLVVLAHASMDDARSQYFGTPFQELIMSDTYKNLLVLYAHGDGHKFKFKQDQHNPNLYDLQCDEGKNADPLSVTILREASSSLDILKIDRREVYQKEKCDPGNTDQTWGSNNLF